MQDFEERVRQALDALPPDLGRALENVAVVVEDALGRVRFLLWYLAAGVAASALQTFVTLSFGTVQDASIPNIGASGAIAGVLGAYFLLLPNARVLTVIFFILREIPAVWFLGIWIALQLWQGGFGLTHPDQSGGDRKSVV